MALTETSIISSIDVKANGSLQIQRSDIIYRNGIEISKVYHRHVIQPGADVSAENDRVKAVAKVIHTKAVIDAFIKNTLRTQPVK
jgi:hypothetical protein